MNLAATVNVILYDRAAKMKSPNAKSQATDAALSRQVACTDGLAGKTVKRSDDG
jgi:hypothetical protein